jgi:hypothetical protein
MAEGQDQRRITTFNIWEIFSSQGITREASAVGFINRLIIFINDQLTRNMEINEINGCSIRINDINNTQSGLYFNMEMSVDGIVIPIHVSLHTPATGPNASHVKIGQSPYFLNLLFSYVNSIANTEVLCTFNTDHMSNSPGIRTVHHYITTVLGPDNDDTYRKYIFLLNSICDAISMFLSSMTTARLEVAQISRQKSNQGNGRFPLPPPTDGAGVSDIYNKYLKYKQKYLELKKQYESLNKL